MCTAFASLCDKYPITGWLFGYEGTPWRRRTLQREPQRRRQWVFGFRGAGPATDNQRQIYVSTGNGNLRRADKPGLRGQSVETLSHEYLVARDYFTPHDRNQLNLHYFDFGVRRHDCVAMTRAAWLTPFARGARPSKAPFIGGDRENLTGFNTPLNLIVPECRARSQSWCSPAYFIIRSITFGASDLLNASA